MEQIDVSRQEIARCIEELTLREYAILEGALSHDFCDEIIEEIQRLKAKGPPALPASEFTGYETLRYFDLLNEAEVWARVTTVPAILEVEAGTPRTAGVPRVARPAGNTP